VGKSRLTTLLDSAPPPRLADLFAAAFEERLDRRLALLDAACPKARLRLARALLQEALASVDAAAASGGGSRALVDARSALRAQRSLLLQQQLSALRKELAAAARARRDGGAAGADGAAGGAPPPPPDESEPDELGALEARLLAASPPPDVLKAGRAELRRLRRGNEASPGHSAGRAWVEWLAAMPWSVDSNPALAAQTLTEARARLDAEHFGLDKVKERIVQYLAVRQLRPGARPAVLCLLGPPGVGKTSLARSIAAALGRPFARISLGGVRDEAEVRGHRRTYVAAMPGRIAQALRRAGARDPLILLDEVDKLGRDSRGDPAAALLEVLDPEQNAAFADHYLNVPLDLSRVTFLCTANVGSGIPAPLLDRLEVIRLAGYTQDEKVAIAQRHIVPRLLRDHGLCVPLHAAPQQQAPPPIAAAAMQLAPCTAATPDAAAGASPAEQEGPMAPLLEIDATATLLVIEGYTREAGVRSLERALASLCRAAAVRVADGGADAPSPSHPLRADAEMLCAVLGPPRYLQGDELRERVATPGVVAGLVWSEAGGLVQHIEASALAPPPGAPGGRLQLTGTLGDVIKESAHIALSWTRSRANALRLSIDPADADAASPSLAAAVSPAALLASRDIHVHLPAGGVPKDGPSAGVTLAAALVSLFSGRPARADTAMTGELTLSGLVLPVGGIKEKLIAAQRAGLARVLVPARNMPDVVSEVPAATRAALCIVPCATMADVLREAFDGGFPAVEATPSARL
jgi:ATP-dependent Lon protease